MKKPGGRLNRFDAGGHTMIPRRPSETFPKSHTAVTGTTDAAYRRRPQAWIALLVPLVLIAVNVQAATAGLAEALEQPLSPHPRLFLPEAAMDGTRRQLEADPLLRQTWDLLRQQADAMLELAPVQREQVGRRLLGVSRTVLKRVGYLAFAHRITGTPEYLARAEQEMLAVAGFSDWNPSHFLDVAEMTAALALGYDWLYEGLNDASRESIRRAIVSKGLQTSIDHAGGWVRTTNNWSQVCHGGLVMGALAVLEDEPELAARIIARALEHIHRPMDVYGPNGAYPEGAAYWLYGTSYNVLLIDALASALGSDFGIGTHERFMASANYYLHAHGPTTKYFNYSDNSENASVAPPMFWFAQRRAQPELLWFERAKLEDLVQAPPRADGAGDRLLPFVLVWSEGVGRTEPPAALHYKDDGKTPVGIHRTGWQSDATYVGLKAGTPAANHGQMDIGSFVLDADGVRWAVDLGVQDYNSLEQAGIDLWNRSQDSGRWRVFRLNNRSKNTLVVDDALQRVDGFAPIIGFADSGPMPHTIIDMSAVYAGQLASAKRGVGLLPGSAVVVRDEFTVGDAPARVRWGMVTRAEVEITPGGGALLKQNGKQLGLRVLGADGVEFEIYETASPPEDYDAPNPGTRMIGFTLPLEAGAAQRLTVLLQPGGPAERAAEIDALDAW
jgi:hypothetical protein